VTRYERGWRDAIEAAASALNTANVSGPADAKAHWSNAGDALRMSKRGDLDPPKPEPR
jgi:hypothetical protein